ncbi:MAG: hypothetical protein QXO37_06970 [Candidatus Nitrosocaldaceae archaeon]
MSLQIISTTSSNIIIKPLDTFTVFREKRSIIFHELLLSLSSDNAIITIKVKVESKEYVFSFTPKWLLQNGLGLTPSQVSQNPDGSYRDEKGIAEHYLPYLLRYRPSTSVPDITGDTLSRFVVGFSPLVSPTYSETLITIYNPLNSNITLYGSYIVYELAKNV